MTIISTIKERYKDYIKKIALEENKNISGYMSVTEFLSSYKEEFKTDFIAKKVAGKNPLTPTATIVKEMWNLKGDIGRDFGNALHKTMELWFNYNEKPKNLLMKGYIDEMERLGFVQENGRAEVRVRSHNQGLVGTIDLVYDEDVEKKEVAIYDHKTYVNMLEKKDTYISGLFSPKSRTLKFSTILQLTIYKLMLESEGYTVVKMGIIQQKENGLVLHLIEPNIDAVNKILDFEL